VPTPTEPGTSPDDGPGAPVLAVSAGDPLGIGPEVLVKALADPGLRGLAAFAVFGPAWALERAAERSGIETFWSTEHREMARHRAGRAGEVVVFDDGNSPGDHPEFAGPPRPTGAGGLCSFAAVEAAIEAVRRGWAHGIVTAPIAKASWELAGHAGPCAPGGGYPGHTELLADRFAARRTAMLFEGPRLRVILATTHIPLAAVPAALTAERVLETIEVGAGACGMFGIAGPRVAVCGLNPHAGEGGLLGAEEDRSIRPAIERARARGIDASGPWPGDTIFAAQARGAYDLVVAMYHDQGLVAVKTLDGQDAVNVTVGLPAVRTSPAHGTAFDIAGTGRASARGMVAALRLALRLARPAAGGGA